MCLQGNLRLFSPCPLFARGRGSDGGPSSHGRSARATPRSVIAIDDSVVDLVLCTRCDLSQSDDTENVLQNGNFSLFLCRDTFSALAQGRRHLGIDPECTVASRAGLKVRVSTMTSPRSLVSCSWTVLCPSLTSKKN